MENETMNDRLRKLRNRLGISQKEMSESLIVRQSYFSDIENSRRTLTNKFIAKLQKEYNVSKDWLYTGLGYMLTTDSAEYIYNAKYPFDNRPEFIPTKTAAEIKALDKQWSKQIYESTKYKKRLLGELGADRKKYTDLISLLNKYYVASDDLISIRENYLHINNPDESFLLHFPLIDLDSRTVISYEDYKKDVLNTIDTLTPYIDKIQSLIKSINIFLKEIKKLDREKIINIP